MYNKKYKITEIKDLNLTSFTQPWNYKLNMFKLDNLYFYNNIEKIEKIKDLILNWDYIIFDTETNGLNYFGEALPFQISAIRYRNWKEVERFNTMINIWEIPSEILELTKFKQEDIDNGTSLSNAIRNFLNFVWNEKYVIAHNASFDVGILNNALVASNIYMWWQINIICSMQLYYIVYKYFFKLWISGSSLDQLSIILMWINLNKDLRHEAIYDVLIVAELLEKIKKDISYDLNLWDNSFIKKVITDENFILKQIENIKYNKNNDKIINFVNDIAEQIDDMYLEYNDLFYENLNIATAIIRFIETKVDKERTIFLYDELNELTYYIRLLDKYTNIDNKYLLSWAQNTVVPFTVNWQLEVSFFEKEWIDFTNISNINSEESLLYYSDIFINNKNKLIELQIAINNRLKMVKAHQWVTWNLRYVNNKTNKWIIFRPETKIKYNEKLLNTNIIQEDIEKWYINTKEDLLEIKENSSNNIIIEKNLSNIFNLI